MSAIPETLGVLSLPRTVLFPRTLLPLHLIEPASLALLEHALQGPGRMVLAVQRGGGEGADPAVYPVASVAQVVEHQPAPDGEGSDLILKGEAVVRIGRFVGTEPYRSAHVEVIPENGCFAGAPGSAERCAELHRLLEEACPGCVAALRDRWHGDFDEECGIELLHTVAMYLPVSVEKKMEWLCCPGSLVRWEKLRETLMEMGNARGARQRILKRYADLAPERAGRN